MYWLCVNPQISESGWRRGDLVLRSQCLGLCSAGSHNTRAMHSTPLYTKNATCGEWVRGCCGAERGQGLSPRTHRSCRDPACHTACHHQPWCCIRPWRWQGRRPCRHPRMCRGRSAPAFTATCPAPMNPPARGKVSQPIPGLFHAVKQPVNLLAVFKHTNQRVMVAAR